MDGGHLWGRGRGRQPGQVRWRILPCWPAWSFWPQSNRNLLCTHIGILSAQDIWFHKKFQSTHDVCSLLRRTETGSTVNSGRKRLTPEMPNVRSFSGWGSRSRHFTCVRTGLLTAAFWESEHPITEAAGSQAVTPSLWTGIIAPGVYHGHGGSDPNLRLR